MLYQNLARIAAISGLLIVLFFGLLLSKGEILELNPIYAKGHIFSLLPFLRVEGKTVLVCWLSIFICLASFASIEGFILGKAGLKLSFRVGILTICFSVLFSLLSINAILYGIFAIDPDFIISPSEPWLDVKICFRFVDRIALALTAALLPVEAMVVYFIYRRRGK